MSKDRERIERCLAVVDAYEASGQKASVRAVSNGVALRELASWCGHAGRRRARLQGAPSQSAPPRAVPTGFVATTMPARLPGAVRVQCGSGEEPGAIGQTQRARPLGLPARRARATADPLEQPQQRTVAASLAAKHSLSAETRARTPHSRGVKGARLDAHPAAARRPP